jgi:hypothetical protein
MDNCHTGFVKHGVSVTIRVVVVIFVCIRVSKGEQCDVH